MNNFLKLSAALAMLVFSAYVVLLLLGLAPFPGRYKLINHQYGFYRIDTFSGAVESKTPEGWLTFEEIDAINKSQAESLRLEKEIDIALKDLKGE